MALIKEYNSASAVWYHELFNIVDLGEDVSPRGLGSKEILNNSFSFPINQCVTHHQVRKLSYKFMAAEALWIISGDNSVRGIVPYNKHIAKFSDNGEIFNGAYGPPFQEQAPYVARTLKADMYTRQAVMTIWKQRPEYSKDIPCTIALTWNIRMNERQGGPVLNCHVFMRSSDVWLGLPYDMFNFSMMTYYIGFLIGREDLRPGRMHMNLVSSHLYDINIDKAYEVLKEPSNIIAPPMPQEFIFWPTLERSMVACRDLTYDLEKDPTLWKIRP